MPAVPGVANRSFEVLHITDIITTVQREECLNKQDKIFYDSFMIVVGIFTGIILGIVFTKALAQPTDIGGATLEPKSNVQIEHTMRDDLINSSDDAVIRSI
jgi:hypothetical protein